MLFVKNMLNYFVKDVVFTNKKETGELWELSPKQKKGRVKG